MVPHHVQLNRYHVPDMHHYVLLKYCCTQVVKQLRHQWYSLLQENLVYQLTGKQQVRFVTISPYFALVMHIPQNNIIDFNDYTVDGSNLQSGQGCTRP